MTVMATDKGSSPRSSTATVYFNVEDVNDNDPVYNPVDYSEEVPEDVAIGTSVVTLTATDLDSGTGSFVLLLLTFCLLGTDFHIFSIIIITIFSSPLQIL